MTPADVYIRSVISGHQNATSNWQAQGVITILRPHVNAWAGDYLFAFSTSGSLAKGTAISGSSDVDLLVSLKHITPGNLRDMYETLFQRFTMATLAPRRQNVSIGLNINGLKVDVVPARKQAFLGNDHTLWSHKKQSHRQTNVHTHIQLIANSGRLNEIKSLKIWRKLHGLELPSFVAEMIVIRALSGYSTTTPAANFWRVLQYIRDNIMTLRIVDPANSNNVITDDLTVAERQALHNQAVRSLAQSNWSAVIW